MRGTPWIPVWFLIVLIIGTVFYPEQSSAETLQQDNSAIATSTIASLTNADRTSRGLLPLSSNAALEEAAQMKADNMVAVGYFAHNAPDGKTPWYWFGKAGYVFSFAGENLAVYFSQPDQIEKAWMDSPSHKENILNSDYSEIGIGIAHGTHNGVYTTFVVEFFGSKIQTQVGRTSSGQ